MITASLLLPRDDRSRAVMSHYISILDQFLRFFEIILPQIGSDFRKSLPNVDYENNTLTSMSQIEAVQNLINVEYLG